MFYVSLDSGKLVNRTGLGIPDCGGVPRFCGQETQKYTFSFIAAPGQMPPDFFAGDFFLTGAVEYASNSPCFRAAGKVDAAAQTVTFEVDTYTEQYLHNVTRPWMTMYCDITRRAPGENNDVRLCNFPAPADPRVYIPGVPPAPVESYYTREEVNRLFVQAVKHADVMPTPSAALVGTVYVYTGVDGEFKRGMWYICHAVGAGYGWKEYGGLQGEKGDKGEPGTPGAPGEKGADGYTPQKGVDYYTAADQEELLDKLEDKLLSGEWGTVQ